MKALSDLTMQVVAVSPENADYFEDVRNGRAIGVIAHANGRLLHYAFVFKKNKTACLLGLPARTALIGNAYTVPEARGLGIQGASVRVRAEIARKEGFESIAAETAPDNWASRKGMLRGGMQPLGRLDLIVFMNCIVLRVRRPSGFRRFGFCY